MKDKENKRFSIAKKIAVVIGAISLTFLSTILICFIGIQKNSQYSHTEQQVGNMSERLIHSFSRLLEKSTLISSLWIYNSKDIPEKENLVHLIDFEYFELRSSLTKIAEQWDKQSKDSNGKTLQNQLVDIINSSDSLIHLQKTRVISRFGNATHYKDQRLLNESVYILNSTINPLTEKLISQLDNLSEKVREVHHFSENIENNRVFLKVTLILSLILFLCVAIIGSLLLYKWLQKPLNQLYDLVKSIGKRDMLDLTPPEFSNDEFGIIGKELIRFINNNIKKTTEYALKIGEQDYDAKFTPASEYDTLGHALLKMGANLKKNKIEEEQRLWESNGLIALDKIHRSKSNQFEDMTYEIITFLVEYVDANQGSFFVVEGENEDKHLLLKGCYAWDRRKYINEEIGYGEGLTGQAWKDKETIYINNLPNEYAKITSGLGEANPTSLVVVPFIFNEEVIGVMELASFHIFTEQQTSFLEKAATNIAAILSYLKHSQSNNTNTTQSEEEIIK